MAESGFPEIYCIDDDGDDDDDDNDVVVVDDDLAKAMELKEKLQTLIDRIVFTDDYSPETIDQALKNLYDLKNLKNRQKVNLGNEVNAVPVDFRCSISGEIMSDPVILSNGMGTPLVAALAVAAVTLVGRYSIQAWQASKARPPTARMRKFYEGGFQPTTMTRREAALILGIRDDTPADKVKEAHRRVMVANHPDAGGSHYLASKINEAKDITLGKTKGGASAF